MRVRAQVKSSISLNVPGVQRKYHHQFLRMVLGSRKGIITNFLFIFQGSRRSTISSFLSKGSIGSFAEEEEEKESSSSSASSSSSEEEKKNSPGLRRNSLQRVPKFTRNNDIDAVLQRLERKFTYKIYHKYPTP